MTTVRETIDHNADAIMASWEREAGAAASARGLTRPLLRNIMPRYLESLADVSGGAARSAQLLERHLSARIREGFELQEILEEIAALGRAIAARWVDEPSPPAAVDVARLFAALNRSVLAATRSFNEHMRIDEQADKRFIRQLQALATETPQGRRTTPHRERLTAVLEVVCDALAANSVTLLLFDERVQSLATAASVGTAAESLEKHALSVGASSLADAVANSEDEPIVIDNVATMELDVGVSLRGTGIRSILAVRLPSRRRLVGALYIGLPRMISTRDTRRAELLGEQLVKYGSRHTTIAIAVRRSTDQVTVSVHNSGEPIPTELRARLFEPFGQLESPAAGGHHGWGLGLTLVQGVAETHGGSVELESSAESGTTFSIRLPLDARSSA